MKNIHLLPTDKPSRLYLGQNNNFVLGIIQNATQSKNEGFTNQHIYITNNETIKEGDWFFVQTPNISDGNLVAKSLGFGKSAWSSHILTKSTDEKGYHPSNCKKIILTTDQDLINDGIQAVDNIFAEWFVRNPDCKFVEIATEFDDDFGAPYYVICIPKNESKSQTLEKREPYWDLVDKKAQQNNTIDLDAYAKGVIDGAKWQAERMYSEEEILQEIKSIRLSIMAIMN